MTILPAILWCVTLLTTAVFTARKWTFDKTTNTVLCNDTVKTVSNCEIYQLLLLIVGWQQDHNMTATATHQEVLEELQTLKGRLAAAAVLSVTQLLIVIIYLVVSGVMFLVKRCKKHQAKQMEENLEMMENILMQRKSKRRAAAAKTTQETQ